MSKSQRELKAIRQAQREEALRRQRAKERRNLFLVVGGVALLGAIIAVVAVALNQQQAAQAARHLAFQAQTGSAGEAVPDEGRQHIDPSTTFTYQHYPPASGPHYSVVGTAPAYWQTIGNLPEGVFIHNLEHGGIVVLYNCPSGSACDTMRTQLTDYVTNLVPAEPAFHEYKMIMTPYSHGMTHQVALLAWDRLEWLDGYDQSAITRFYELYVNHGPEQIP